MWCTIAWPDGVNFRTTESIKLTGNNGPYQLEKDSSRLWPPPNLK